MSPERKIWFNDIIDWLKPKIKMLTVGGIIFLLGVGWKTVVWFENTKTTNTELPLIKQAFQDFRLDVSTQLVAISTKLDAFISDHKEEDQIKTQMLLNFQAQQIKTLKERNRETAYTDTTYNH